MLRQRDSSAVRRSVDLPVVHRVSFGEREEIERRNSRIGVERTTTYLLVPYILPRGHSLASEEVEIHSRSLSKSQNISFRCQTTLHRCIAAKGERLTIPAKPIVSISPPLALLLLASRLYAFKLPQSPATSSTENNSVCKSV